MSKNTSDQQVIDKLIKRYPVVGRRGLMAAERSPQYGTQPSPWTATDFARTIPYWFLAVVGLIYASGFLIEMIHLGTYGIRDVGGELWKARDIHIGVLGFVFPATIMGTMVYTVFTPLTHLVPRSFDSAIAKAYTALRPLFHVAAPLSWRKRWWPGADGEWWFADLRRLANGFIILSLELSFYALAMLHRDSASEEPYGLLAFMLAITILSTRMCSLLEEWARERAEPRQPPALVLACIIRLIVAAAAVYVSAIAIQGYWPLVERISSVNPSRVLLYVLLFSVTCYWLYSTYQRYRATHEMRFWLLTCPLVGLMYYLTVVGFAHSLFPYVPASRGGGDYMLAPIVSIQLKKEMSATRSALETFLGNGDPKVVIDETSTTLFIADECTKGGPLAWSQNRPRERPRVWAVSRDSIAVIQYAAAEPDVDLHARCPRGLWSPSEYPAALFRVGSSSVPSAGGASVPPAKAGGKERQ